LATDHPPAPGAAALAGLLAEPDRLRVVAALVLGATTVAEVQAATGLGVRAVVTALGRLVDGELVERDAAGTHVVVEAVFRAAAVAAAPVREDEHPGAAEDVAKVLRAFVRGGRLVSLPTQRSKRLIVLDLLAQEFEPGQRYPEREVNRRLRVWHDDTAALRRALVDEEFLARDHGEYWRAGGTA
jgi:DNA-binding transcriptional ArsR family regulator